MMKKTKIVCTIGPSSKNPQTLARLIDQGMDVARINMSHERRDRMKSAIANIRQISEAQNRQVAVLQDLSGAKIRLGKLEKPMSLEVGGEVVLTAGKPRSVPHALPVNYPYLHEELEPGDRFSMAEGMILMEVVATGDRWVRARVLSPGEISSHKGINLPKGGNRLASLTEKDALDLRTGLEMGIDMVALSFVRTAEDAERPRKIMDEVGRHVPLLAKIEKPQAIENIEAILDVFDGVMLARGDLGIEVPMEEIPIIQKDIIRRTNRRAKPVITATQMLLSMVSSQHPTRAEVTDVANAILDGTDAVMLSEETAIGKWPVETVRTMTAIAERAERLALERPPYPMEFDGLPPVPSAIARTAREVAHLIGAALIVTPTSSGFTPRLVASTRPAMPILALTYRQETMRGLCLSHGVRARLVPRIENTDGLFELCREQAIETGLAKPGDLVVVTAGVPIQVAGTTNLLKVMEI